ncbi:hypothetical protein Poli38472_001262 [Pythium oligandrum]|uniref:Uncharacterized protein n=1 Tax=Pythium oligandrum TaxID=41045 RepID=A0A8K1FN82_PYTOL|nr:hypothetical protein Poli38472_001262 [Pythium oligandrum]|eukprot:TMW69106.1 hypothetical protein Poli38472_001262 [Pythium oligandrum]
MWWQRRASDEGLRENDAWRIAMSWKNELQGCVRLTGTKNDMHSVIPSYEWVEFILESSAKPDKPLQQRWLAAQAACVSWTLLSCCEGYSGSENPVFWKRVFCEYGQGIGPNITDTARFFTAHMFPRFRLNIDNFSVKSLEDHLRYRNGISVKDSVETLKPFIIPSRLKRTLEVSISLENQRGSVGRTLHAVSSALSVFQQLPWAQALRPSKKLKQFPPFKVSEVDISELHITSESDANALIKFLRKNCVRVPRVVLSLDEELPRPVVAQTLLAIANAEEPFHASSVSCISFCCPSMGGPLIGALFSVLPLTKSLETLEVIITNNTLEIIPITVDHLWRWLNYASFHPDIAQSAWRNLRIENPVISEANLTLLRSIRGAEGKSNSTSYRTSVKLQSGAIIHEFPALEAQPLCVVEMERAFDVSDSSVPDWVSVVVPGFGCGWVPEAEVERGVRKPAALSQIRGLYWQSNDWTVDLAMLIQFLEHFGQKLRLLWAYPFVRTSAQHVLAILRATPCLRSLAISHDGSVWSTPKFAQEFQGHMKCLRELALSRPASLPCQASMDGPLANLTALSLVSQDRKTARTLMERNPRLHYLCLVADGYFCVDYRPSRRQSREELGIIEDINAKTHGPLSLDNRLAFLSVLKHLDQTGAVEDRWDEAVLSEIFSYVTNEADRDVWVESLGIYDPQRVSGPNGPPCRVTIWGTHFG